MLSSSAIHLISSSRFVRGSSFRSKEGVCKLFVQTCLDEMSLLKDERFSEDYFYLSQAILILANIEPSVIKRVVFYGVRQSFKSLDKIILNDTLATLDLALNRLRFSSADKITFLSLSIRISFELFKIIHDDLLLDSCINYYLDLKKLFVIRKDLEDYFGWTHFEHLNEKIYYSDLDKSLFYACIGRVFLTCYYKSLEISDLIEAKAHFEKSFSIQKNSPHLYADYAECCISLGMYRGQSSLIEQGMKLLSKSIFLSFNKDFEEISYQNFHYAYALAAIKLYYLTYKKEHFQEANRILKQTTQSFPNMANLWIVWGELLIQYGWLNNNISQIELGLDKLASTRGKQGNPIVLSALLASGISILGLYLEEPNLFRESKHRLIATMKIFPSNSALIFSLGVVQLCSALYFEDDESFHSAASCFHSCLGSNSLDSVIVLQKLFDTYFAWGIKKKRIPLLHKALKIAIRLCALRPEVFVHWSDRGLVMKFLAEFTADSSYKEIFLQESISCYEQAWILSSRLEILELWGQAAFLLGELLDSLEYYDLAQSILKPIDILIKNSARIKLMLGKIYLNKGILLNNCNLVKDSVSIFNSILNISNDDENIYLSLGKAYLYLFFRHKNVRDFKLSKLNLFKASSLGNEEVYYLFAQLYSVTGDIETSWEYMMQAMNKGLFFNKEAWYKDVYLSNLRAEKDVLFLRLYNRRRYDE